MNRSSIDETQYQITREWPVVPIFRDGLSCRDDILYVLNPDLALEHPLDRVAAKHDSITIHKPAAQLRLKSHPYAHEPT